MSSSDAERARVRPPTERLHGIVEQATYHAEDSGYTVARLKASGARELITIVGSFPDIHAGQTLRLLGYYREHAKYGQQFQVVSAQETKPATLTGLEKYLGSKEVMLFLRGHDVSTTYAVKIYKQYGDQAIEIVI